MSGLLTTFVTIAIIALSAFFVAVEFSLMAAKKHRFEDAAPRSRAARAALRNSADLTLLLAGSQLGITVCTLALGAITKPAVHHALTPLITDLGLPLGAADVVAFVLALVLVTFLHLVVGEMMPKSWSIAHPEKSAMMLALPMRAFMTVTRPLLVALNGAANWLVRKAGVEPVDELSAGHDADELRQLVEHSADQGTLDASYQAAIESALELRELTLGDLLRPDRSASSVPESATAKDVQEVTLASGHMRVLVRRGRRVVGVVHVRDTVDLAPSARITPIVREPFVLDAAQPLHEALASMRESRHHLAVVTRRGLPAGVVSMSDILVRLFPQEPRASVGTPATTSPGGS